MKGHFLLTVLGLLVATGLYAGISLAVKYGAEREPELAAAGVVFGMLLFLCVAVVVQHQRTEGRAKDLENKLTTIAESLPRVSYYEAAEGRDRLFDECRRLVQLAERDIMALNWLREERDEPLPSRNAYFGELMTRSKRVRYRRVLQAAGHEPVGMLFHSSYIDHFKAMVAERDHRTNVDPVIELSITSPSVPSTFLIVDDEHLVWELIELVNPRSPETSSWRMRGLIVVHDRGFVEHFKNTWEHIHARSTPVTASQLPTTMEAAPNV